MQESVTPPAPQKAPRKSLFACIWAGLGALVLLAAATAVCTVWYATPTGDWRNAHSPLPWHAANVTIADASAVWKSSEGNEHMALRTAYYPEVRLKLTDCRGNGMIYLSFYSITGSQIGETLRVRYSKDGFQETHDEWFSCAGNEGAFRMSKGFETPGDYTVHTLRQDEQFWRVDIRCLPEGEDNMSMLGHISILPEDK